MSKFFAALLIFKIPIIMMKNYFDGPTKLFPIYIQQNFRSSAKLFFPWSRRSSVQPPFKIFLSNISIKVSQYFFLLVHTHTRARACVCVCYMVYILLKRERERERERGTTRK